MPDAAPHAIEVRDLTKRFRSGGKAFTAVDAISFTVARDSVFGILGANGAGKTTLLRMLTTTLWPDGGTAFIEGFELRRQELDIRKLIGIVAQENHFDRYLTAWQNLRLHADMHGLGRKEGDARIQGLLEQVDLWERRHDMLEDFSGGMQRRVALIRALIHQPKLLFLDEPTTGLDPAARLEIWETIQHFKQSATVILTTHYMDEADRLADRIMIMNHGQIVMTGTPDELKQKISPPDTYEIQFHHHAERYLDALNGVGRNAEICGANTLRFTLSNPDDLKQVLEAVPPAEIQWLGLAQADLETVYMSVAAAQKADAKAAAP